MADIIWSILPIIFWNMVELLYEDGYRNIYIMGYSFQFINMVCSEMFLSGSFKSWLSRDKKINYTGAGFFCYILSGLVIYILLSLFGNHILPVFGYTDPNACGLYRIYAWQFLTDGILMGLCMFYQYRERRKSARILSYGWFLLRMGLLIVFSLFPAMTCVNALITNNMICSVVCFLLITFCVNFKNMKFNIREWMSREAYNIASHFAMFVIYFLGVGNMTSSATFMTAYNVMTICTDVHWDLLGSINTYTATETLTGNWNEKKKTIIRNVAGYGTLLFLSSFIMILLSGNRTALFIWFIEMSLYIPDCMASCLIAFVSMVNPNKWIYILAFSGKIIRLIIQIFLFGFWGMPIACFVGCLIFIIGSTILYKKSLKVFQPIQRTFT